MQGKRKEFLEKESVIEKIISFGDDHEIPTTARRIAEAVKAMKAVKPNGLLAGSLLLGYQGIHITYGRCGSCGNKLIWYTENKPTGCPYCRCSFLAAEKSRGHEDGDQEQE